MRSDRESRFSERTIRRAPHEIRRKSGQKGKNTRFFKINFKNLDHRRAKVEISSDSRKFGL